LALTRRALHALAFIALLLAGPTAPGAHSLLVESMPPADATISALPPRLVLRFNNRIEKKLSRVRLVGRKGERLEVAVDVTGRADTLTGALPDLTPGAWRLEWQVLSTDGHVVSGAFSFRLSP
jgi:copper resistance protein C